MSWTLLRAFLRGPRSPYRRYRPQVESLEGRWLPSTVTNLNDAGPGSLRDAIAMTPAGGAVDFQSGLTGTITLTSATLTIDHSLTITGPGANTLTVSSERRFTVFMIPAGVTATIADLAIKNGSSTTSSTGVGGGGITNLGILSVANCLLSGNFTYGPDTRTPGNGGAIYNQGTLTITASTLSGNSVGSNGRGGGIYNNGVTTIRDSTLSGNSVAGNGDGGGIYDFAPSYIASMNKLTVMNSTIAGNFVGATGSGGGIANQSDLTVINSTISNNAVHQGFGGGLTTSGPKDVTIGVVLTNTIIAGNTAMTAPDINIPPFQPVKQADHNLIGIGDGDPSVVDGQNGNQVGSAAHPIDPKLGPLQDNGGPTLTMTLLPGSPAIDAGNNAASPGSTDQRGQPRIANRVIDVGAYEFQGVTLGPAIFAVAGAPGRVQIRRASNGFLVADFAPYGASYTGGVSVAVGDVDGDGFPDLVTAATSGNPHVKVFSGQALLTNFNAANPDASLLASFFAYGLNFNVGASVAIGDVNHDGFADIVTGASAGNPHVKVYDGQAIAHHTFDGTNPDASLLASFFAYGLQFNVGVNVAAGDVNHDGFADVVTAPTAGNPQVKVYDGQAIAHGSFDGTNPDASLLTSFFAFGLNFDIGAFVSVADVTGNGFGDVIVGASAGNPQVKVYDGRAIANHSFDGGNPDANLLTMFFAYGLNLDIGASVSAAAFDVGGPADILTGAAQGAAHYRLVRGLASGIQPPAEHGIDAVATDITGGILVGA